MYDTIVVGTDGSSTAKVAVTRAGRLAALCGARVHLVHGCGSRVTVADPLSGAVMALTDDDLTALTANLEQQAAEIRALGVDVEVHLAEHSGADALLGVAETVDADLIVVGSHGMTGKRRLLLGSVPNAVSHHADCSVLIVHTD